MLMFEFHVCDVTLRNMKAHLARVHTHTHTVLSIQHKVYITLNLNPDTFATVFL